MRRIKLLVYFLSRSFGLFRLARWLTRGRLKILCYHGFAFGDEAEFRPTLFIRPERFEKRLATIRRCGYRVLSLDRAIDLLYSGRLPGHTVVITVDDGFHSFYRLAVPRLKRFGFPATLYVTTYYIENPWPVYRLVVQYMFWKTRKKALALENVAWSDDRVVDLAHSAQREEAMWDCINYGELECSPDEHRAICEDLGERLGTPFEQIALSKKLHLMTPDELRSLPDSQVDIQLHTHRHTFPPDEAVARREIRDNRVAIKRLLNAEAHHFCYPSGQWEERHWPWLESMNVKSSTTCLAGLNTDKTPRHALRRFLDGENIHQLEFEAELSGFAELLRGMGKKKIGNFASSGIPIPDGFVFLPAIASAL